MPQPTKLSPGDMTGRMKQHQAHEQAQALKDRQTEISMATAVEVEELEDGLFDPQSGSRLNEPRAAKTAVIVPDPEPPSSPRFGSRPRDTEPVFTGKEPVEQQPRPVEGGPKVRPPFQIARGATVDVRLNSDLEGMTYGMYNGEPNNYNFREGLKYRVPVDVAEHLYNLGYLAQWSD